MNPFENKLRNSGIFPGSSVPGMGIDQRNMDLSRKLSNDGIKVKGTKFNSVIGTTEIDINLSGQARLMVGFKIVDNFTRVGTALNPEATCSLVVNNDVIIQDAPIQAFNPMNFSNSSKEWYEFIRSLNGSDNIKLIVTDTANNKYNIYFYYV